MRLTKYLAAAAALSLSAAPALAAGNPASSLSLAPSARAAAPAKHDSDLLGGGLIIAILAGAAVIVGIVVIADNSDSN